MNTGDCILINASANFIPLPSGIIHSHCTSPPYWRQRDYSQGDESQACYWPEISYRPGPGQPEISVPAGRYELGMEPTPEYFIGHLVAVYREVARVCRADSAGWCVVGDCFWDTNRRRAAREVRPLVQGEEDGQLIGIPHRLALALQADGWLVRNDVCWSKKSPMPESVAGSRWERCRVKVSNGRQIDGAMGHPKRQQRDVASFKSQEGQAQWQPCPGCPACEAHGGYVLRRGSARHTRAHETILQLTKSMAYYTDYAKFREDVSEVQKYIATNRLLHQQENWAALSPLQGMSEGGPQGVLLQREGPSGHEASLGEWWQGEEGRISETIPPDGTGQGSFQTIRDFGEGQGEKSQVCAIEEGQGDKEKGPCQSDGKSSLSGTNAGLLEKKEQREISQGEVEEVYQISQGPQGQAEEGQEIQGVGEGIGIGEAVQYPAPASHEGQALYLDSKTMESDQSDAETSLLLLQEENREFSSGSRNASESGRGACDGECSSGLPRMQYEKEQQTSKRNPRSVLHVSIEEELYQQFLDWRVSIENNNPPSVLNPKPESYPGQHYATYPRSLISQFIQATCPTRTCPVCGAGWAPVVERKSAPPEVMTKRNAPTDELVYSGTRINGQMYGMGQKLQEWRNANPGVVLGYRPTCECYDGFPEDEWLHIPGLLLDPFVGSGTSLLVARELGLRGIGLDLSGAYLAEQAAVRVLGHTPAGALAELPLFAEVE